MLASVDRASPFHLRDLITHESVRHNIFTDTALTFWSPHGPAFRAPLSSRTDRLGQHRIDATSFNRFIGHLWWGRMEPAIATLLMLCGAVTGDPARGP